MTCRWFTFHVGALCGGGHGVLLRWFGRADSVRWTFCVSAEGQP